MARLNLRSFAQPDLLKGLQAANLLNLLEPFRMFFEMKGVELPADLTLLEQALEEYFSAKKRGVGCRITRMDGPGEARFLVEHGQPCKREPSRKGRRSTTTFFRPEKTDIVIYDAVHDELRINAASLPDMREYRKLFSLHLFGSEDCFVLSDKYTLTPLQTDGIDALNCRDIAGMERVDLCEIEYAWPGPFQHRETLRSANLFSSLAVLNREIERDALIVKAIFKIKWEGQRKLQTVTIKAGNKSGYTRGEESMIVEDWLRARGFILTRGRTEDAALEEAMAIA